MPNPASVTPDGDAFLNAENEIATARLYAARELKVSDRTDCADCGEKIPDERKKAAPFATRCIACQQANESGH